MSGGPTVVVRGAGGRGVGGVAQGLDVDLGHAEHGLDGGVGTQWVGVTDQLDERVGNDLPGQAEAVLDPAARADLATPGGELLGVPVNLVLAGGGDLERGGLGERERRAAVEGGEWPPGELEGDGQD